MIAEDNQGVFVQCRRVAGFHPGVDKFTVCHASGPGEGVLYALCPQLFWEVLRPCTPRSLLKLQTRTLAHGKQAESGGAKTHEGLLPAAVQSRPVNATTTAGTGKRNADNPE